MATNPELLISALDEALDHEVSLVVYGRASIALGFDNVPDEVNETLDIEFLVRHACITGEQLEEAFREVQIPDIQELRDAFERARPVVLKLAKR